MHAVLLLATAGFFGAESRENSVTIDGRGAQHDLGQRADGVNSPRHRPLRHRSAQDLKFPHPQVGQRVKAHVGDYAGAIGRILRDDGTELPLLVEFDDGEKRWYNAEDLAPQAAPQSHAESQETSEKPSGQKQELHQSLMRSEARLELDAKSSDILADGSKVASISDDIMVASLLKKVVPEEPALNLTGLQDADGDIPFRQYEAMPIDKLCRNTACRSDEFCSSGLRDHNTCRCKRSLHADCFHCQCSTGTHGCRLHDDMYACIR